MTHKLVFCIITRAEKTSHNQYQNNQNCSTKTKPTYAAKTKTHFNQIYSIFKTTQKPYSPHICLHKQNYEEIKTEQSKIKQDQHKNLTNLGFNLLFHIVVQTAGFVLLLSAHPSSENVYPCFEIFGQSPESLQYKYHEGSFD